MRELRDTPALPGTHSEVAARIRERPAVCALHVPEGEKLTTTLFFTQRAITALGPRCQVHETA